MVFQRPLLLKWRSTLDNVLLQAEMRGLPRRAYVDRARELLTQVGLAGFERSTNGTELREGCSSAWRCAGR